MRVLFYDDLNGLPRIIEVVDVFEDDAHYLHLYSADREEGFTSERPLSARQINAIMKHLCMYGTLEINTFKVFDGDMFPKGE